MRLHLAAGDRTGAARQYERCVAALKEELGITPSPETVEIYQKIYTGGLSHDPYLKKPPVSGLEPRTSALSEVFARLRATRRVLNSLREQLEQDVHLLEQALELDQEKK
jgi:DNA-binding SARP family transcriptional activator